MHDMSRVNAFYSVKYTAEQSVITQHVASTMYACNTTHLQLSVDVHLMTELSETTTTLTPTAPGCG